MTRLDSTPSQNEDGFLLPGPLTHSGEEVVGEVERAVNEGRLPISGDDVRLLASAVQTLADFGQLLNVAAVGGLGTLDVLRARLQGIPGAQVWRDLVAFTGRRPVGPILSGPCGVSPIDLGTLLWTGFHLGDGVRDPVWVNRAFAEYGAVAGPVERVLAGGREWIDSGRMGTLREGFAALNGIGKAGQRPLRFRCLDEQQVCLGELLNFSRDRLSAPTDFPQVASVVPTDVCTGYTGTITLLPVSSFPAIRGVFLTIDRQPAVVVSWTPNRIVLQAPTDLEIGCHTIGWGYLMDSDAVLQLRGIAEQCLPWYPTLSLKNFPLLLWRNDATFSVIGEPAARFDSNGATSVTAEACEPVTLVWAVTLAACAGTKARPIVTMLRNNLPFRPTLTPTGSISVSDVDDATYTLRAVARIGAQTCGSTDRSVTITREKRLRVGLATDRCVDTLATVPVELALSCPAPPGGLPVTVTSSHPARIANTSVTIDEGSTAARIEAIAGTECGPVTLTISAPGHTSAHSAFVVAAAPQITGVTPTTVQTCDNITITLTGDCLGESAALLQARLLGSDRELPLTVTVRTPQTEIGLTRPPVPAGVYTIELSNCGRTSFAPTLLSVEHRPPVITRPLAANATVVLLCSTPTLTLSWQVQYASLVRVTRGGVLVTQRTYDACLKVDDSVSDAVPTITAAGVNYVLTAMNPVGDIITGASLSIPAASPAPSATSFLIINNSTEVVNAFLINGLDAGGVFLGSFQPGQGALIGIPICQVRGIASLSPGLVEQHNKTYPNSQYSATAVSTVRTAGPWTRNFSGYRLGQASTGVQGVSI